MSDKLIAFEGLAGPVAFEGAGPVLYELEGVLRGWPRWPVAAAGAASEPMISVDRCRGGYAISVSWRNDGYVEPTPVSALCSLVVDLVEAYVRSEPGRLCLHCAAVKVDGRLLVFPAASRAGKSTLTARLAAAGRQAFTDDLLALDLYNGKGMAFGVPPRLRRPLPPGLDPAFTAFIEEHAGPKDAYYAYLDLPPDRQAHFGTVAPLGAVVLLERDPGVLQARLEPAEPAHALRLLLGQSLTIQGCGSRLLEDLHDLLAARPCLTLHYSDLEQAVALLQDGQAFSEQAARLAASPIELRAVEQPIEPLAPSSERSRRFQQKPGVRGRAVGEHLFLTEPDSGDLCELNLLGAGVWNLLAEPHSLEEVTAVLVEVFEDAAPPTIVADTRRLLSDLEQRGLIQPC
ncbi:PqqD family protein [Aquibaculum arenosum]|uniref:PqqD family protein n=1 Tax=Aquibaculum arenosum TaxID=3032591 RepID=A0ABT5YHK7_9PROT|nr:PqqD family protein [Fodinicurvata sp. CAU 1616]MDF2094423.1 PqqD family protein [Fodinicurvata sp. CAU 1616]